MCAKTVKGVIVCMSTAGWTTYQTSGGVNTKKVNFMLTDQTGHIKCTAFGEKFAGSIVTGRSVVLQHYICKDEELRIIAQTKVFRYGQMYTLHSFLEFIFFCSPEPLLESGNKLKEYIAI